MVTVVVVHAVVIAAAATVVAGRGSHEASYIAEEAGHGSLSACIVFGNAVPFAVGQAGLSLVSQVVLVRTGNGRSARLMRRSTHFLSTSTRA